MKVLVIITTFVLFSSSLATRLLSSGDLQNLLVKFANNETSQAEFELLINVLEMYKPESSYDSQLQRSSRTSLECVICGSIFSAFFELIANGHSDEDLTESVTVMCTSLAIVTPKACRGAVELNIPILSYIIKNTPEATPRTICSLLLQNSGNPNVCVLNDQRFEWEVDIPNRLETTEAEETAEATTESRPLTIALVTDAHIDPYYEAYGVADCDEPTCCRKGQRPSTRTYKTKIDEADMLRTITNVNGEVMLDLDVLASVRRVPEMDDVSPTNTAPAGYWGDYRNCDTPIWAYDDVIDRMAEAHPNIDVIYYMGDSIDHHVWETTYEMINDVNVYIIDKLRASFGDDVLIVPVIGNHESQPTNQFAPSSVQGELINTTWLYDALARKWDFYLTEDAKATVRERGDFSMLVRPGLRVISINNNVAYRYNWWLVYDPADPKKHLDFLVQELYKAELVGEKVHILTHIPPGVHDLTYTWTREYNKIINRFTSTIVGEFNGHTHSDEFKVFYSSDGTPSGVAWGAGSATTYSNYNLNYKIATFNSTTFEPLNIVNYVYNLTEANLTPHRRPHWFQLYDIKNSFGIQDLSPASMNSLVRSMVTDRRPLLDLYSAFYSKLSDKRWPYCNDNCKIDNLCKTVVTVLWERQRCEELRELFFI